MGLSPLTAFVSPDRKGNRLQITADVDLEGIAELKAMLGDYESILKRLVARKSKKTEAPN
jgi:hypothetical protein